jgi:2-C-methyl-D-erythritol 4-phosphate cytidylyltransferase
MYQEKRIAVIIAAAGSGTRMGSGISKQYLTIGDDMVLAKTLQVFGTHPFIDDIFLVVRSEDMEFCRQELVKKLRPAKLRAVITGGKERQDSVYNALQTMQRLIGTHSLRYRRLRDFNGNCFLKHMKKREAKNVSLPMMRHW